MKTKLSLLISFVLITISMQNLLAQTSWNLSGNAGTNTTTDFLGTTDNKSLVLRTKNIPRIQITNKGRVGIGIEVPLQKLDVNGNINIDSTSGFYINNIKVLHTLGSSQFATGQTNFFAGQFAGNSITDGFWNAALGYKALHLNTSGGSNTACGYNALYSNTTGGGNTASGTDVMHNNTEGFNNTASGALALFYNTTGYKNTAVGYLALENNTEGQHNTALGSDALETNTTGDHNTAIGYLADVDNGNYHNGSAFGYQALITASNQVRIGNSAVTSIGGYANWSNISDGRFKKNLKQNVPGLAFIKALKPVTYNLDIKGLENYLQQNNTKNYKATSQQTEEEKLAIAEKEKTIYSGFVAQEVEKEANKLNYNFSGVDAPKNNKDPYSLRYADFVVPLVKAVQELSSENDSLKLRLEKIEQILAGISTSTTTATLNIARLEQNAPNPFSQSTVINYYLPENSGKAFIKIADVNGKVIKTIAITTKGKGQLTVQPAQLAAGTYYYSLVAEGKLIDSKKMMLLK